MNEPTEEMIRQLKEKHADRALHLVELKDAGDPDKYYVIMTGANADEYQKFQDDTFDAQEKTKNVQEKNERLRFIAKLAVMRQAVWPARDDVKDLLHKHPGFVLHLAEKIHEHAGSSAEVRSKKL